MYIKFLIVGLNILLDGGPQRCTGTSREVGILLHQTALQRRKTREGCEGNGPYALMFQWLGQPFCAHYVLELAVPN